MAGYIKVSQEYGVDLSSPNCNLRSNALLLELSPTHDARFGSAVSLMKSGQPAELLRSLDDATDGWPPSPPIQDCLDYQAHRIDPNVLLMTGMAGTAHWSTSVRATPDSIEWDVACRTAVWPEFVGSTWILHDQVEMNHRQSGVMHLTCGDVSIRLLVGDGAKLEIDEQGARTLIRILPVVSDDTLPTTLRWKYQICSNFAENSSGGDGG